MILRLFRPSLPGIDLSLQQIERAFNDLPDLTGLPTFADDTAAGSGGLAAGQFYKTASGQVMVKL